MKAFEIEIRNENDSLLDKVMVIASNLKEAITMAEKYGETNYEDERRKISIIQELRYKTILQ
jgi:hydroxymethylpyrimidine/phosphomethylpyrimidine kinase